MKQENKLALMIAIAIGLIVFLGLSPARAQEKEQWAVDGTTGLHLGVSAGMGFTLNSMMIAAEGRRAGKDSIRPWMAFGVCMVPGVAKEYLMDGYPSYTDLAADLVGCGLGVWSSGELFVTPTPIGVQVSGRF